MKYAEDSVIISEGEKIDKMFKVISGGVAIYLNYGKENEYLVGVLTEKRHFGEEGLLSDKPSIFTAIAFKETHLMTIGASEFEDYLKTRRSNATYNGIELETEGWQKEIFGEQTKK